MNGVLAAETLHLTDSFSLIDDEFLVPHGSECLELSSVLLLNLHLLPGVLVDEGHLEARLSFLSDLHDTCELHLSLTEIAIPFVEHALSIKCL